MANTPGTIIQMAGTLSGDVNTAPAWVPKATQETDANGFETYRIWINNTGIPVSKSEVIRIAQMTRNETNVLVDHLIRNMAIFLQMQGTNLASDSAILAALQTYTFKL